MDRRAFVYGAGSAALMVPMGWSASRALFAQAPPDREIYRKSTTAFAETVDEAVYKGAYAGYWSELHSTLVKCLSEWQKNKRDVAIQREIKAVPQSKVSSDALNQEGILRELQRRDPEFSRTELQRILSYVDNSKNKSVLSTVFETIEAKGMSYYINLGAEQAARLSEAIHSGTIVHTPLAAAGGLSFNRTPSLQLVSDGSGYNCAKDGAVVLAVGLAFAVLTVMTSGIIDVLAGAAWAGIALWGGVGATSWGVAHILAGCSF